MKNILFCAIWERTYTWLEVAKRLSARKIEIYMIVTSMEFYNECIRYGVKPSNILFLRVDHALDRSVNYPDPTELIVKFEKLSGYSLKTLLYMDRYIRDRPWQEVEKYSKYTFHSIHEFICENNIKLIVGEPTTTHDLIALMIAKTVGIQYAAPFNIRLPCNRFLFWNSECEVSPIQCVSDFSLNSIRQFEGDPQSVIQKVISGAKMQGFYQKTSLNLSVVNYVLKLFRGFFYRALIRSRHDGHMYNLRSVFLTHKYHLYPVRFILNSLFKSMIYDSPDYSLRYVLFTLNYQPEHSIDVEAPFWTNQLDVISTIAKSLPADCHLFVKEHPNSLGLRSFSFYRKVRSLPNTRVLSYDCDIKALIQRSELVACITGTVALEANFMNVPSVTLGSTFMDRLSLVTSLRCPSQIASVINNPPERDEELDLRIIKELLDCSFKGSVSDVITDPSSLDRENLNDLEAAFFALVQSSCSY